MLIKQIKVELIKLKRGRIWSAFVIMPIIPVVFGTVNYLGNIEILDSLWNSLWTQQTLFACYFFTPMLIGVYCAYLWRMEHMGSNWNQTLSLSISEISLILSKLLLAFAVSALMLIWTFALFIISGLLIKLPLSAIPSNLALWFAGGLLGSFAVCSLQLLLGLIFSSFAIPVGLALLGGIWGLMMLSKDLGFFCPYSLLSLGMYANNTSRTIDYPAFILSCTVFIVLFNALSVLWMKRVMTK